MILISFRSALLICASLSATAFTPARAGPATEPLAPVTSASLPEVAVPDLLDPDGEPQLANPAPEPVGMPDDQAAPDQTPDVAVAAPIKPQGDLAAMVEQLRSPDPGSAELDCLATGIYFESKS